MIIICLPLHIWYFLCSAKYNSILDFIFFFINVNLIEYFSTFLNSWATLWVMGVETPLRLYCRAGRGQHPHFFFVNYWISHNFVYNIIIIFEISLTQKFGVEIFFKSPSSTFLEPYQTPKLPLLAIPGHIC